MKGRQIERPNNMEAGSDGPIVGGPIAHSDFWVALPKPRQEIRNRSGDQVPAAGGPRLRLPPALVDANDQKFLSPPWS